MVRWCPWATRFAGRACWSSSPRRSRSSGAAKPTSCACRDYEQGISGCLAVVRAGGAFWRFRFVDVFSGEVRRGVALLVLFVQDRGRGVDDLVDVAPGGGDEVDGQLGGGAEGGRRVCRVGGDRWLLSAAGRAVEPGGACGGQDSGRPVSGGVGSDQIGRASCRER